MVDAWEPIIGNNPKALARLDTAISEVCEHIGLVTGSAQWGDPIASHHPARTGMMAEEEVELLENRPARLRVDELTADECLYFWRHAVCYGQGDRDWAAYYFIPRAVRDSREGQTGLWSAGSYLVDDYIAQFANSVGGEVCHSLKLWLLAWLDAFYQWEFIEWEDEEELPHLAFRLFESIQMISDLAVACGVPLEQLRNIPFRLTGAQKIYLAYWLAACWRHEDEDPLLGNWLASDATQATLANDQEIAQQWPDFARKTLSRVISLRS